MTHGSDTRRLSVHVMRDGDTLGFEVRHDKHKRVQVSQVHEKDVQFRVGDTLLSVNGIDLTGQALTTVLQHVEVTKTRELVFDIERHESSGCTEKIVPQSPNAASGATTGAMCHADIVALEAEVLPFQENKVNSETKEISKTLTSDSSTKTPHLLSIPVPADFPVICAPQPRKRARPVTATLVADLKKERAGNAALEEKNAALRKRLQRMLIENDEVRVRAKNEVTAAQEKAKIEIANVQSQLAAARAQLRLQDRSPDVARTDSILNELNMYKAQLERQKKTEMERTKMLTTRYWGECRIAIADAQRVLDSVVEMFRSKLRLVGRMRKDGTTKPELEVTCDGVRRLTFMKLFNLAHEVAFYMSAAFHSQDPVHHTLEQGQFVDLFGNSLCHEERAGFFYVAIAPMVVVFDPSVESVSLKCKWTEKSALRDIARNVRF
ncbi:hypothetical protein DD238_002215 [Peronospora effusa]|uniref:PDZ domain-containing protein n=1 Tax=Peronospora effusa TaxID=542832 RepID=A0A3M6VU81_9STRA|nr:hypothetical protein DD238_002215 [Peronospora effusa]RQM14115.1 hypothetical protein DD237_003620 [Peronospora effusa]